MLLEQIIQDAKKSLLYMERYVNDGSPSGFTQLNQTSYNTAPLSNIEYFYLDMVVCDRDKIETVGELPTFFNNLNKNAIFIHPDMSPSLREKGLTVKKSNLRVCPTSSSRTVKLLDYPGYFKLNYNGLIGRIDRSLTDKHAYASVELTRFLDKAFTKETYSKISFLHETAALIYRYPEKNINIGLVYREEKAKGPNADEIKYIIPFFSLFSQDKLTDEKTDYLFIQLIQKSNMSPFNFTIQLIYCIIDNYFKLLLNEGLQPEWHAQNLLLGLDSNLSFCSIIMRDLESIDIDQTLQHSIGIQKVMKSYPYKHLNSSHYNYQIKHSFMYDFKIGEYIFSPLINCVCDYYNLNPKDFENCIKDYAKKYIKRLPSGFFPKNRVWYSFEKVLIDRTIPERPYLKNENAKYRG